jgi:hypothetical protein
LSLKTKVDDLLVVWPQNHWDGLLRFGIKTGGDSFLRFGLKTGGFGFFRFGLQNQQLRFGDLGHKITTTVSLFGPQNQVGDGLSVAPQNRWEDDTARGTHQDPAASFTRKQVRIGFSSLASRLAEVQPWVVDVAPSWRLRRDQVEDRRVDATCCIGLFYPKIIVLYVLGP